MGGLGGRFFKYIVLGQIRLFCKNLQGKSKIIAVGGVGNGKDVFEYALVGASGVGIGTSLLLQGPFIFSKIKKEISEILKEKQLQT